jgi:hypothetical protein
MNKIQWFCIQRLSTPRADTTTTKAILDLKGTEKRSVTLSKWNPCTLHPTIPC